MINSNQRKVRGSKKKQKCRDVKHQDSLRKQQGIQGIHRERLGKGEKREAGLCMGLGGRQ